MRCNASLVDVLHTFIEIETIIKMFHNMEQIVKKDQIERKRERERKKERNTEARTRGLCSPPPPYHPKGCLIGN